MNAPTTKNIPLAIRLFFAWVTGGALYFITLVTTEYDGFNTFVTGIFGGAIISAACVGVCAVAGLLLLIPFVKKCWRASVIPAFGLFAVGLSLFIFGLSSSQVKTVETTPDGEAIKEVGLTWMPGLLFIVFAITNFYFALKSNPKPVEPS